LNTAVAAFIERHFAWLAAALIAITGVAQFTSAVRESPTWDESCDIAAGYAYLRTGDYSLNADHPPLGKLLNALPLLALELEPPPREKVWTAEKAVEAGKEFVFENRAPAERIVLYSRVISMVFILAVGDRARWRPRIPFHFWLLAVPAAAALVVLLVAESVPIHPHYLAFFNWVSGGPGNGPEYLLDSNLDWGQDLRNPADWTRKRNIPVVCLSYFGTAPPEHYGLVQGPLPESGDASQWEDLDCLTAVSATSLFGLYVPHERFAWLRRQRPTAKIGYSIYVYDLRKTTFPGHGVPAGRGAYDDRNRRIRYFLAWDHGRQFPETANGTLSASRQRNARVRFVFKGPRSGGCTPRRTTGVRRRCSSTECAAGRWTCTRKPSSGKAGGRAADWRTAHMNWSLRTWENATPPLRTPTWMWTSSR
jgi:hypothetical protein